MDRFEDHLPALRAWFGRRLRNAFDVDDAVQDVWLRIQAHLHDGRITNLQSYLFQTAQSVMADRARRAAVRPSFVPGGLDEFQHPVEVLTPERVLMGKQAVEQIMAKVHALPERTRDIFILHRFENMSYNEIANAMGISVSAIEKHIMKALQALMDDSL